MNRHDRIDPAIYGTLGPEAVRDAMPTGPAKPCWCGAEPADAGGWLPGEALMHYRTEHP